ncbi:MAG: hypothetical protein LAP87_11205 [Acidobacteriia bacterium]|nr:hypothetical protein [Terriglobia bacterium]
MPSPANNWSAESWARHEREFPRLAARYRELYARGAHLGRGYKDELRARVVRIRERYGLASGAIEYRPELWEGEEQGELFPLQ